MAEAQNPGGEDPQTPASSRMTSFTQVPIEVTVAVGRASPSIQELLGLDVGSILTLDKALDDPVELFIGDRSIGFGLLEVSEESGDPRLSVRLTEIADLGTPTP